jgi:TonB-dependent SusC/RagA subfamily outer membrane receptor
VVGNQAIDEPNEAWTNERGEFSLRGPDGEVWLDACSDGYEFSRITLAPRESIANFRGRRAEIMIRDTALYGSIIGTPRMAVAGVSVQPLYVVDGRPVGGALATRRRCGLAGTARVGYRTGASMVTGALSTPSMCILDGQEAKCDDVLKMLKNDKGRVEKVEILKGALAASLYGALATNGVLVVSTPR